MCEPRRTFFRNAGLFRGAQGRPDILHLKTHNFGLARVKLRPKMVNGAPTFCIIGGSGTPLGPASVGSGWQFPLQRVRLVQPQFASGRLNDTKLLLNVRREDQMPSILNEALEWLDRAEQAREVAGHLTDPGARKAVFELAESFDRLARAAATPAVLRRRELATKDQLRNC